MPGRSLILSVLLGAFVALVVGAAAWVVASSPRAVPRGGVGVPPTAGESVFVRVEAGDNASAIATRLTAAGVIEDAGVFRLLASLMGADRSLAAGEYEFRRGSSALDAVVRIRDGLTSARIVTVPEGLRLEEVAALLEQRGVVSAAEFLAAARGFAASGAAALLLSSRPQGVTLEGYVYPATYSFARSLTAAEVVGQMVSALDERLTPALREEARARGLSLHEVLTLASIVEREAVVAAERPVIASVFLNRLAQGMALQADPTVQYAVSTRSGGQEGWWKRSLTAADLQFDSPYNTYTRGGLPPGPIANPGLDSILAVLRPEKTSYLYFVARPDGSHAFATTFEEHERNVERFQR
jgi:UPF0755 protein